MFETLLIKPLYNGFVALVGVMPQGDMGLAIIALTLIMRAVLYPVFTASLRTQMGLQAAQGELEAVNEKYKKNPEERMRKTRELFAKYNIRPLMGFAAIFVQFAVFIALYFALFREGFPNIDQNLLYAFVNTPTTISTNFFGLVDLLESRNALLALVVALTQYVTVRFTISRTNATTTVSGERAAAQRMQQNMLLYAMPVLMGVVSFFFPSAFGLYLAVGNLISLGQEWLIRKHLA